MEEHLITKISIGKSYSSKLKPFGIFLMSFVIAWIYVLIPITNSYWLYQFIKTQWFVLFAIVLATELQDFCLPDASYRTYIWSYVLGFFSPPIVSTIGWCENLQNNYYLIVFAHSSILVPVFVLYLLDAYYNPIESKFGKEFNTHKSQPDGNRTSEMSDLSGCANSRNSSHSVLSRSNFQNHEKTNPQLDKVIESISESSYVSEQLSESSAAPGELREQKNASIENYHHDATVMVTSEQFRKLELKNLGSSVQPTQCLESPRSFYRWMGYSFHAHVQNRILQWLWALLYNITLNADYFFLMNLTTYCRSGRFDHSYQIIGLFFLFVAVSNVLRFIAKRIGKAIDQNKDDELSMFAVGEVVCLLFYYTFYRLLFESIPSYQAFFVIELIHLSQEWLFYAFRSSEACASLIDYLIRLGLPLDSLRELDLQHWQRQVACDFGFRCCIMVSTALGILLLLLSVDYVPWVSNTSLQDTNQTLVIFLLLAVVLELVNAGLMVHFYFLPQGCDVLSLVTEAFDDVRFSLICCVAGGVLFINPIVAFSTAHFSH